jgi:hypothetical protein
MKKKKKNGVMVNKKWYRIVINKNDKKHGKKGDTSLIWEPITKLLGMVKLTYKSGDKLKKDHPKNMIKIPCKGGCSCC